MDFSPFLALSDSHAIGRDLSWGAWRLFPAFKVWVPPLLFTYGYQIAGFHAIGNAILLNLQKVLLVIHFRDYRSDDLSENLILLFKAIEARVTILFLYFCFTVALRLNEPLFLGEHNGFFCAIVDSMGTGEPVHTPGDDYY